MCHLNAFISRIEKFLDFLLWLNKKINDIKSCGPEFE